MWVSIHAPTWGATHCSRRSSSSAKCFNPRAHVGRDLQIRCTTSARRQFQSTRPRGARLYSTLSRNAPSMFQSTRPRGARRHGKKVLCLPIWCFNPRAHVGRDELVATILHTRGKFQSTRPRGARLDNALASLLKSKFQSTRPRGARPKQHQQEAAVGCVSIHAPTWGATGQRGWGCSC